MRAMNGLLVALLLPACVVGGGERTVVEHGVAGLRIELGNGEVEVQAMDGVGDRTEVALDLGGVGARTARGETWVDTDGWLVVDARGLLGGGEVHATVPATLPVEVFVDRGEATVLRDRAGDVVACVAAGEVTVEVPSGAYRLDLDGGAGEVSAVGVWDDPSAATTLSLCVGAGEVAVVGRP